MEQTPRKIAIAGAVVGTLLAMTPPATAAPGDHAKDGDTRACVTHDEWAHLAHRLDRGKHPRAAQVELDWEVQGMGVETVMDMTAWGFGSFPSMAYPRCSTPDMTVAWWGFVADESGRVVTATGYHR